MVACVLARGGWGELFEGRFEGKKILTLEVSRVRIYSSRVSFEGKNFLPSRVKILPSNLTLEN